MLIYRDLIRGIAVIEPSAAFRLSDCQVVLLNGPAAGSRFLILNPADTSELRALTRRLTRRGSKRVTGQLHCCDGGTRALVETDVSYSVAHSTSKEASLACYYYLLRWDGRAWRMQDKRCHMLPASSAFAN